MKNFSPDLTSCFICKKCGHKFFRRSIIFGIICPKCWSFNVEKDNVENDHWIVR